MVQGPKAPDTPPIDEILRKYGVLEENKQTNVVALFNNFVIQLKPDSAHGYLELCQEFKSEPPDFNKQRIAIQRTMKNCRMILAEYVTEMAHKVTKDFFSTLLIFAKLYKDYMNLYGWNIIAKYKSVAVEERCNPFTLIHDAEHVPEGSNDFLKSYLPRAVSYTHLTLPTICSV
eukprot:TRINITY_DN11058_c0_g1_i5.p1 TRINITY_DN11058_c0_g1~~TRINITY_DN11058_c0_g1_i5.p1  ORF type:complete len:174 (+),score=54.67 TRINITY_DN11058_c0_g1_i5:655-1176(+)